MAEVRPVPWGRVVQLLTLARNYWIASTRPDGRPHCVPVWGVWLEGALYFSTPPHSQKGRNIARQPKVVVHLESADEVVMFEGDAHIEGDPARVQLVDQAFAAKYVVVPSGDPYHLDMDPGCQVYLVRPGIAHAWVDVAGQESRARWVFDQ
jgi:hypothetical protein